MLNRIKLDSAILFSLVSRASLLIISLLTLNEAKAELVQLELELYFQLTYLFLFLNSVVGAVATHGIRRLAMLDECYWYHELKMILIKQGVSILIVIGILTAFCFLGSININVYGLVVLLIIAVVPFSQIGMVMLKGRIKVHVYEIFLLVSSFVVLIVILFEQSLSPLKIILYQFAPVWMAGIIALFFQRKLLSEILRSRSKQRSHTINDYSVGLKGGIIGSISKFGLQFLYSTYFQGGLLVEILYIRRLLEILDAPIAVIFNAKLPKISYAFTTDRLGYFKMKKLLLRLSSILFLLGVGFIYVYLNWSEKIFILHIFLVLTLLIYVQRISSIALVYRSIEDMAVDNKVARLSLVLLTSFSLLFSLFQSTVVVYVAGELVVSLIVLKIYYENTLFGSRSDRV